MLRKRLEVVAAREKEERWPSKERLWGGWRPPASRLLRGAVNLPTGELTAGFNYMVVVVSWARAVVCRGLKRG